MNIAPVFGLFCSMARNVVVKEGHLKTGVEQLVATTLQQFDNVVLRMRPILLKIEEV